MLKPIRNLFLIPAMILIVGMACQLSGGPTPPRSVTISQEQSKAFEQSIQSANVDKNTGKITIKVTESQLSSYVYYNLKDKLEPTLLNPIIILEPNRVELYGNIQTDSVSANGRISFSVKIDSAGKPNIQILDANFGPIPIPTGLLDSLTKTLDKSIADGLSQNETNYLPESIEFATGSATVVLRKK